MTVGKNTPKARVMILRALADAEPDDEQGHQRDLGDGEQGGDDGHAGGAGPGGEADGEARAAMPAPRCRSDQPMASRRSEAARWPPELAAGGNEGVEGPGDGEGGWAGSACRSSRRRPRPATARTRATRVAAPAPGMARGAKPRARNGTGPGRRLLRPRPLGVPRRRSGMRRLAGGGGGVVADHVPQLAFDGDEIGVGAGFGSCDAAGRWG